MLKGLLSDDSVKKVELLEEFITAIQATLFQNIHKAKYSYFYFWVFFLTCINNALKE